MLPECSPARVVEGPATQKASPSESVCLAAYLCIGATKRYVRRDRDSKAAGTTLVCHCRCSAVPGSMLLKAGTAGLDDADCARARILCSTGSKPGLMHGGTGIRTRGPGTAAGLRFSRPPQ